MNLIISAIICTHNRCDYLRRAIESLVNQTFPKPHYEIIIVDNNSSDGTKDMIASDFHDVINLRYVFESMLNLSVARNTGWKQAQGKYAAYLDDDAAASPEWIEKIVETFETKGPMPGCVGGPVKPIWPLVRPKWLSGLLLPYLSVVDWSSQPMVLNAHQWIVGTNMAFPKIILEQICGFPVDLGRKGSNLLSGEERLVQLKIQEKGLTCFYNPEIQVEHRILPEKMTRRWFLHASFSSGISEAILNKKLEETESSNELPKWKITLAERIKKIRSFKDFPSIFTIICYLISRIGWLAASLGVIK